MGVMETRRLGIQGDQVFQGQVGFRRHFLAVAIGVQFSDPPAIGQLELVQAAIWLEAEFGIQL